MRSHGNLRYVRGTRDRCDLGRRVGAEKTTQMTMTPSADSQIRLLLSSPICRMNAGSESPRTISRGLCANRLGRNPRQEQARQVAEGQLRSTRDVHVERVWAVASDVLFGVSTKFRTIWAVAAMAVEWSRRSSAQTVAPLPPLTTTCRRYSAS